MVSGAPLRCVIANVFTALVAWSTGAVLAPAGAGELDAATAEPTIELFSGTGGTAESGYGYGGAVWSPRGLYGTGWRLRSVAGGGAYRYRGADGLVDAHFGFGEVMAGYQWRFDPITLKTYGGLHIEDHDLQRPDPSNPVQGTKAGVKGQAELWVDLARLGFVSVDAGLSSVYASYSAKGLWASGSGTIWRWVRRPGQLAMRNTIRAGWGPLRAPGWVTSPQFSALAGRRTSTARAAPICCCH